MWSIVALSRGPSPLTGTTEDSISLHEKVEALPGLPMGPFARRADGAVVCIDGNRVVASSDEARTWETIAEDPFGAGVDIRIERAMLHVARGAHGDTAVGDQGALILAYEDYAQRHWTWADAIHDAPGAIIPTCTARSLDGGRTWQDIQKLHPDWTGAIRDMIQTRSGRVIFTTMKMLHDPGRHSVMTYASDDAGATWMASNLIDYGGIGHHDGATEATLVELNDGRLMKYIRTNWGQFWRAESTDGGHYWHTIGPSGVDASSAPGLLFRTRSGRIALFWNRTLPEGQADYPLNGGDRRWSAVPCSNHREELSLSWSDDECQSWSPPVVLARKPETWLSYPYAFEAEPGVIWLTTMQGNLRLRLREADFVGG
jgi:hypothetical protein